MRKAALAQIRASAQCQTGMSVDLPALTLLRRCFQLKRRSSALARDGISRIRAHSSVPLVPSVLRSVDVGAYGIHGSIVREDRALVWDLGTMGTLKARPF